MLIADIVSVLLYHKSLPIMLICLTLFWKDLTPAIVNLLTSSQTVNQVSSEVSSTFIK